MREIKFRVWATPAAAERMKVKANSWVEHYNLFDSEDIGLNELIEHLLKWGFLISQYTGLKAKNSKEIYEGDICKDTRGHIDSIKWEDAGWNFWVEDCLDCYSQNLEVIGNIYENPELIK